MDNRIYRSRATKMLGGVCGGIADMYNIDPTLVRLVAAALVLFSGFTFVAVYVLCMLIIPLEPSEGYLLNRHRQSPSGSGDEPPRYNSGAAQTDHEAAVQPVTGGAPIESAHQPEPTGNEAVEPAANTDNETVLSASDETVILSEADRY